MNSKTPPSPSAPTDGGSLARSSAIVVLHPMGSNGTKVVLGRQDQVPQLRLQSRRNDARRSMLRPHHDALGRGEATSSSAPSAVTASVVIDVAFSPDGEWHRHRERRLYARIWETQTGRTTRHAPRLRLRWVRSMWSSDGEYHRRDHELETDGLRLSGHGPARRAANGSPATANEIVRVASNPRLEQFATSRWGPITWDVSTLDPAVAGSGPSPGRAPLLAYSPNGTLLATGGSIWCRGSKGADRGP